MKYKCIKDFDVEICDYDCMPTGKFKIISSGTVWELDEDTNYTGGDVVHLDNNLEWIEIPKNKFEECFDEVK